MGCPGVRWRLDWGRKAGCCARWWAILLTLLVLFLLDCLPPALGLVLVSREDKHPDAEAGVSSALLVWVLLGAQVTIMMVLVRVTGV